MNARAAAAAAAAQRTAERRKSRPRVAARPYSGKQDKRDKERQVARRVPVEARRGGAGPVLQQPRDEARPSSDQPGGAACVQRLSQQEQTSRVSTYTIRMKKSSDHEGARQVELVLGMVEQVQPCDCERHATDPGAELEVDGSTGCSRQRSREQRPNASALRIRTKRRTLATRACARSPPPADQSRPRPSRGCSAERRARHPPPTTGSPAHRASHHCRSRSRCWTTLCCCSEQPTRHTPAQGLQLSTSRALWVLFHRALRDDVLLAAPPRPRPPCSPVADAPRCC